MATLPQGLLLQQLSEIKADCEILLGRALMGTTLTMFGADGAGRYGRSTFPHRYRVDRLVVDVTPFHSHLGPTWVGHVQVHLAGYDSAVSGHAATDHNLAISINQALARETITPTCWTWASLPVQGRDHIVLTFDPMELMFA